MGMTFNNLCNSCTNIGCEFQSGIVRTECAFYMPPHIEPDNCGNYIVQGSTTKNDCAEQNGCTFCSLENGEDCCRKLYEESMQEPTTKNNLGVDCINRQAVLDINFKRIILTTAKPAETIEQKVKALPSVTRQTGHWIIIDDCEKFIAKCSECGRIEDSRMISKYPYCHCGAKMESEE